MYALPSAAHTEHLGCRSEISAILPASYTLCIRRENAEHHISPYREGEEGDNFYVIEAGDFVAVKVTASFGAERVRQDINAGFFAHGH